MIFYKAQSSKLITEHVHKTSIELDETLTIVFVTILRFYKWRTDISPIYFFYLHIRIQFRYSWIFLNFLPLWHLMFSCCLRSRKCFLLNFVTSETSGLLSTSVMFFPSITPKRQNRSKNCKYSCIFSFQNLEEKQRQSDIWRKFIVL